MRAEIFIFECNNMLTREEIVHIASLARIGLSESEIESYRKDLSAILDYFKQLEQLDTENVEPISHITGMENVFRADHSEDFGSLGRKAILENAPETKDEYIKVKSVL
jgi:aspartyl-tRNA(Asn)/glutamyl-tRNA(Gln) amidotransferase subunit C